ncbi:MAG: 1-acyl-sn-glycerol-3-phosphate acyltransferase [Bacteroidales bacterium]|nr:1-acyl-sn-glycerol-3-phosphate acyltransferase [Bacteroidales bacterium]
MDVLKSVFIWMTGVLLIVVFFPLTFLIWLLTLPFDKNRVVIHRLLNWQSFLAVRLIPIWKLKIEGREKAAGGGPFVIISNHQSILDILFINCLSYRLKWVSKIENMKIPILGWYLRMADYIVINRGDQESKEKMMEKSMRSLRQGISVMMFPEGTRSVDGEPGFFKRGAFQMAVDAGVPILPVVLDGSGGILPKHGLIFTTGHRVKVRVFDPVPPESFNTTDPDMLSVYFSNFITRELSVLRRSS